MTDTLPTQPAPVHRSDYLPPTFTVESVDLHFDLDEDETRVTARLQVRRGAGPGNDLVLQGEDLELLEIRVDGAALPEGSYRQEAESLTIEGMGDDFVLETVVRISPSENTSLLGLYTSGGSFCTQCEAEGFRRITFFPDRPDVMARYSTTIDADRGRYPVLLSNGNRVAEQALENGRHRVRWEDPYPKPSYLFALVAGDLHCHRGTYTTGSGREVALEIWVEHQNADKCEHALRSLADSMAWDEQRFGLEYDLDLYMIVAVSDFNFGAMENKGLNIFNSKYVLARPETATDADYEGIQGVIGHEYFHNWTGNRVTCRDWFQLTLKEGLTVYRDQEFSADMTSAAVKRIDDVGLLRLRQLPEDAGPMAHPIRPESYIQMDNFYTATVYEKGSEVVRMYATLLGAEGFRRGMDLYFERHDGQAVTCDDFRAAMADANQRDFTQFERWYSQAGTPILGASGVWDEDAGTYTLTLTQACPEGQDPDGFEPLHIPVRMGLVGPDGRDLELAMAGDGGAPTERVLELTEREADYTFTGITAPPTPSLLRGYSAPVRLDIDRGREELAFLLANDSDSFSRWDAGQELLGGAVLELAQAAATGGDMAVAPELIEAFRAVLNEEALDGSMLAVTLSVPSERELILHMDTADPSALRKARRYLIRSLALALEPELQTLFDANPVERPYSNSNASVDRRRARNIALGYLCATGAPANLELAEKQFEAADNMTDSEAALACLCNADVPAREAALESFYETWHEDPLVIDKWFSLQARSTLEGAPARVEALASHPAFTTSNPNRARALIGAFAMDNLAGFHDPSGEGYRFLSDKVLEIDGKNPQLASRLASAFLSWRRFDGARQGLMKGELERISATEGLSKNTFEIVQKALA